MELFDAIGAALGLAGPYAEIVAPRDEVIFLGSGSSPPIGHSLEVLGGAVGPDGRVAWIEQRSDPPEGQYVPVVIDVRLVVAGQLHVLELATYNPYFGCSVGFAAWIGDAFVFVYSEKHHTILARIAAPFVEQQLVSLSAPIQVGDRIADLDTWQGIVRLRRLADLQPGIAVLSPLRRTQGKYPIPPSQSLSVDERGQLAVAIQPPRQSIPGFDTLEWTELRAQLQARSERVELPLPPDQPLPPASVLRKRWRSLLPRGPEAEPVIEVVGAPWLSPEPIVTGYGFARRSLNTARESLTAKQRDWVASVATGEVVHGWPDAGSFEERLDRVFLAALRRIGGGRSRAQP